MTNAVRIKTTSGWQDIAIQGAPGPVGGEHELASVESASDVTVTGLFAASPTTILTLPSVTFDGLTTVILEFWTRALIPPPSPAGSNLTAIGWWDGSSQIGTNAAVMQTQSAGNWGVPAKLETRITPTAGAHVFSVRAWCNVTGGVVAGGTTGAQMFARIKKVATTPAIPGIPLVTSLPTAPVDGQEIYYQADATNGIVWHLRYNSASASAYKWEYIGGPPLSNVVAGSHSTSSGAFVSLSGPSVVVPRVGNYRVQFGARVDRSGADSWGEVSPKIGTAAVVNDYSATFFPGSTSSAAHVSRSVPVVDVTTDTTAGRTIEVQYGTSGVTVVFMRRWLEVTPIRLG